MSQHLPPQLVEQIEKAVEIIKKGGIIAFPTDTVYGLGADALNSKAVKRIYEIKQRPQQLPLPVLLADETQLAAVADSVSEIARLLMRHFWPGGLTLVLPKAASFPGTVTADSNKVAIRVPNHNVALFLIRRLGTPLIGTSANISNQPSALTAQEVEAQLSSNVDLIIDGGRCPGGLESTVVDVTGGGPVILRQGAVPEEEIKKVCREYGGDR